jgi:hypothetical protein
MQGRPSLLNGMYLPKYYSSLERESERERDREQLSFNG